jgi:hypothetical protein
MESRTALRAAAAALFAFVVCAFLQSLPALAAHYVLLTIYNDTHVAITELYDRKPGETFWGINDLAGSGAVKAGHSFYIRMEEDAYGRCPAFYRDVKLVFANGVIRILPHVSVCDIDVHVHKP